MRNQQPIAAGLALAGLLFTVPALANHSVNVEGEADFDGDGLLGMDEDLDGDQVFGTISGGLAGVSQNGRVTVVTSGRFHEQAVITAAGAVVLEAAPGVEATLEAFQAPGSTPGNPERQGQPGLIIDSNGDFPVVVRNIGSRNWTVGVQVLGASRVTLDGVRADSNTDYGIQIGGIATVAVRNADIAGSGFRRSGTEGILPPNPGIGIAFQGSSSGAVTDSVIAHSAAAGIANQTGSPQAVIALRNTFVGNSPDLSGVRPGDQGQGQGDFDNGCKFCDDFLGGDFLGGGQRGQSSIGLFGLFDF